MAEVTDKDVEKSREKLEKLNQEKLDLKNQIAAAEAARNNTVSKVQLDTESEVVSNEIAALKEQLKVSKSDPKKDHTVEDIQAAAEPVPVVTEPVVAEDKENK